jgi:hypothetical protein
MARVRIHFLKKGYACFVSHVDLPMLFWRAARRSGFVPEMTRGFSPHPRLALGPPLPVGVVGLREPADFWFAEWRADGSKSLDAWRQSMPRGVEILGASEVDANGVSLNKLCRAAEYVIEPVKPGMSEDIADTLAEALRGANALHGARISGNEVILSVGDLEQSGASWMVRTLTESGIVSGWGDLFITRTAVGRWSDDESRVVPLTEEF